MSIPLRIILIFGIFLIPSFIFAKLITSSRINRKLFSILSSLAVGLILFILAIMFVKFHPLVIGLILFILAIPGTFPASYLLYPGLKSRIESRITKFPK